MNWKRNPTLVMGLCATLGVAVIIIIVLLVNREGGSKNTRWPQPPPVQQKQPAMVPISPPLPSPQMKGSSQDYQTIVGSGKPALVLFYADWCGISKKMMPTWQKVEQILNKSGKFEIIALEEKTHREEIQKHDIRGFPNIRLYPDGFPSQNYIPYRGNRSPESLIKFVQSGGREI